ncbi:MAG: response regulator, partial [Spirochaetaceae bacterium]|nr:response regulator [Spirochaetaceae bacterium]
MNSDKGETGQEEVLKQTILIADDSPENIAILQNILGTEYRLKAAPNGAVALKIIQSAEPPDLCLLDVRMPEMNGYEVCRRTKSQEKTHRIPIIFVTSLHDISEESRGFEVGAVDYIRKPISPSIVLARVKTHLTLANQNRALEEKVSERTADLKKSRLEIIYKLGTASEFRDNETGMHVKRIGYFCRIIGAAAGFSDQENEFLYESSPMHDIGKIGIPDQILLKPGKLEQKEWEIMKKHTTIGGEIVGVHTSPFLRTARIIALSHHEKWDGSGYPRGLSGTAIPKVGRITALADVFDALTSVRPYKKAWSFEKTLSYIKQHAGKHFDPELTEIFLRQTKEILE